MNRFYSKSAPLIRQIQPRVQRITRQLHNRALYRKPIRTPLFYNTIRSFSSSTNFYDVLGISKSATAEDIKKAYRKKALEHHPDRNQDNRDEATKKFQAVSEAYETLSNPDKRRMYDMGFGSSSSHAGSGMGGRPGGFPGGGFPGGFPQGRPMTEKEAQEMFSKMFGGMNLDQVLQDLMRQAQAQQQRGGHSHSQFRGGSPFMDMRDIEELFSKGGPFGASGGPFGPSSPFGGSPFGTKGAGASQTSHGQAGKQVVSESQSISTITRDGRRIQQSRITRQFIDGSTENIIEEKDLGPAGHQKVNPFAQNPFIGGNPFLNQQNFGQTQGSPNPFLNQQNPFHRQQQIQPSKSKIPIIGPVIDGIKYIMVRMLVGSLKKFLEFIVWRMLRKK